MASAVSRWLRWLLLLLVVANLLLLAAVYWKKPLQSLGWLPAPSPQRVDLPWQPLPPTSTLPTSGGVTAVQDATAPQESTAQQPHQERNVELETPAAGQPNPPPIAAQPLPSTDAPGEPIQPEPATTTPSLPAEPSLDEQPQSILACIVIGPYTNENDAQAAMARVEQAGGRPRLQTETISAEPDYLVYVEPAVAKDIATRTGQALKSQSIDAYVIPSGTRQHGVSVGVFKDRNRAVAQQERISELGYVVKMDILDRSATMYRIVARDVPSSTLAGRTSQAERTGTPAPATNYVTCDEADLQPSG